MSRPSAATAQERVALDFLAAWTEGDRPAALALCHPDLVFQGPIERRVGASVQVTALMGVARGLQHLEVTKVISAGEDVVVFYDLTSGTVDQPTSIVTSVAEANVVVDGLIVSLRAFFDTHPLRGGSR